MFSLYELANIFITILKKITSRAYLKNLKITDVSTVILISGERFLAFFNSQLNFCYEKNIYYI